MPGQTFSPNSFQTFGDLLKYLRRRERLTQLELSINVGYSEAQIGRLEKNQRRPDLTALKALFIPALHIEDEPEIVERLLDLAQSARQEDAPAPGIPPYKGLLFFDEQDAELFFGRETLTGHLADRVSDLLIDSSSRLLTVVGASGSGKSSLVRAGLAVELKHAGWDVRIFTPGANPLKTMESHLELNHDEVGSEQALILVDQFEEMFTLCHDEAARALFIEKLLRLAQDPSGKTTVVIALRADFYSHCALYPSLRQAVAAEQEYIGQMTTQELRCAIEEPAKRGGWEFEPGLVDFLLSEIGAHDTGEPEPGALPLLSHALLATWERRRGRTFTLEGYHASGGVRGAIAETAESVFNDKWNQTQQEIARDVFLRLTELGEGTEDTRRRVSLNELVRPSAETTQLRGVLNTLAEARLITLNEDSAEVAHEALIREWARLHEWLTQDREGLLLHRHLTEAAHEWETRGRDPAELYRGARLAQVREWALTNEDRMNATEQAFLSASIEREEHDALEREAQRQRELDAAKKLAETQSRSAKELRQRAIYLFSALVLAIIAALTAGIFVNRNADNFTRAEAQRLAAEAGSLTLSAADPQLVALLSLRSINTQYTIEGDAALIGAAALPLPHKIFTGHDRGVYSVAFSPDGKYILTGSYDGIVRLIDPQNDLELHQFVGNEEQRGVRAVFSLDGRSIFAGSNEGTIWSWDLKSGNVNYHLSTDDAPIDIKVSPDGKQLLTGSFEGNPLLLDAQTGAEICHFSGHTEPVWGVTFSPDSKYVATASLDRTARLWAAESCELLRTFDTVDGLASVDFSPDGKFLATAGWDGPARLWDVETGQVLRQFIGHSCYWLSSVRFSPDGKYLLTGSCDRTAKLWDVETGLALQTFNGHTDDVLAVAFSPDGQYILTAGDKTAWLWDLQHVYGERPQFLGHTDSMWAVAISPDSRQLVTGGAGQSTRLWDARTGQEFHTFAPNDVNSVVFSSNGQSLLTGDLHGSAWLWDIPTGQMMQRFDHDPSGERGVFGVAFSPDGKYALTSGEDGYAKRWDMETSKLLTTFGNGGASFYGIAYSPNGDSVLTGGWDGVMHLYDIQTGKELRQFTANTDSIYGVAFSPDGSRALSAGNGKQAILWDIQTGQELLRLTGHTAYLYSVAFSPDGKLGLTGSADNTARLWDLETGLELRRFTGHNGPVEWAVFSSDGKSIITASDDGTARMWSVDYQDTMNYLCSSLLRDFTDEEREQYHIKDNSPTCPVQ